MCGGGRKLAHIKVEIEMEGGGNGNTHYKGGQGGWDGSIQLKAGRRGKSTHMYYNGDCEEWGEQFK